MKVQCPKAETCSEAYDCPHATSHDKRIGCEKYFGTECPSCEPVEELKVVCRKAKDCKLMRYCQHGKPHEKILDGYFPCKDDCILPPVAGNEARPFLDDLWRRSAGVKEEVRDWGGVEDLEELRASEWSPKFERLMRNRLIVGAIRYGRLGANGKPDYDRCEMVRDRIRRYEETGNLEFLVDAANGCLLEFVEGKHPNRHLQSDETVKHQPVKE